MCRPEFYSTATDFQVILKNVNYVLDGETGHETDHDKSVAAKRIHLLQYCNVERSREEMQEFLGVSSRAHFKKAYLRPLLESGQLQMTLPDKPQSRNQKYVTVQGDSAE